MKISRVSLKSGEKNTLETPKTKIVLLSAINNFVNLFNPKATDITATTNTITFTSYASTVIICHMTTVPVQRSML